MQHLRALRRDDRGAVYVEFLIVLFPVLFLFLGTVQASLLYGARLVVQHSANRAVRSAVVVLDDDPRRYSGESRNEIHETSGVGENGLPSGDLLGTLGGLFGSGRKSRLGVIRSAAYAPLSAISPSSATLSGSETLEAAFATSSPSQIFSGTHAYVKTATAVTFPVTPGSSQLRTRFGESEQVTVRVTYLFHCGVPFVSRFMCDDLLALQTGLPERQLSDLRAASRRGATDEISAAATRLEVARKRLAASKPLFDELDHAEMGEARWALAARGHRFYALSAEATLTNQGANYEYTP